MNTQVDTLVQGIRAALAQPAQADPERLRLHEALGLDGPSVAITHRATLTSWAADPNLPAELRQYVREQLAQLPGF